MNELRKEYRKLKRKFNSLYKKVTNEQKINVLFMLQKIPRRYGEYVSSIKNYKLCLLLLKQLKRQ